MTDSIHGHEVMHMIVDSQRAWTREELIAAIREKFGANAHFHTCSASEMSAEELVDFLEARGKLVAEGDRLTTTADHICQH